MKTAEIITPQTTLHVVADDSADDRILECAQDGNADLIVSGDLHLRRLRTYQEIPIVTVADFRRTLAV